MLPPFPLMIVDGGSASFASHLWVGFSPGADGTLIIDGGTVEVWGMFGLGWNGGKGTVIITNGKISSVGANLPVPAGAQRIDATGKWVTPGLINSATQLGIVEIGAVADTRDTQARGKDNIAAAFTVWDGLNPNSVMLAPARKEGVTTFVILPTGGLVSGQAAIIDLVEGTTTDMIMRAPVAMVVEVGDAAQAGTGARGELMVKLRELLEDTKFFMTHRAEFDRAQTRDFRAAMMLPLLSVKRSLPP